MTVESLLARERPMAALGNWTHVVWAVLPSSVFPGGEAPGGERGSE